MDFLIFDEQDIIDKVGPFEENLRELGLKAFSDFQKIVINENKTYSPQTRALMMRDHFKEMLEKASFFDGDKINLVPRNNTFFVYVNGVPITFNKLNNRKKFFLADINEIEKIIRERYKPDIEFIKDFLAEQYRESLRIH